MKPKHFLLKNCREFLLFHSAKTKTTWFVWKHKSSWCKNGISLECRAKILVREKKKRKHEYRWKTRKNLPSRLPGFVRYAKNKKTVSAESWNITFMIANKTFFFSPWTHNLFVPRKRAKWKVTSQWAFYDAAREEHSRSFPAFCHESCNSVRSPLLKPWICLFRQSKFLHVKVHCLFVRRSRWRKHVAFFYLFL